MRLITVHITYIRYILNFLTNTEVTNILFVVLSFIMTFSRSGRINAYGNFDRRYARGSGRTPRQRSGSLYRRPRNLVRYPRQTSGYLYQNASYFSMSSWSNTWFFYQSISYFQKELLANKWFFMQKPRIFFNLIIQLK